MKHDATINTADNIAVLTVLYYSFIILDDIDIWHEDTFLGGREGGL